MSVFTRKCLKCGKDCLFRDFDYRSGLRSSLCKLCGNSWSCCSWHEGRRRRKSGRGKGRRGEGWQRSIRRRGKGSVPSAETRMSSSRDLHAPSAWEKEQCVTTSSSAWIAKQSSGIEQKILKEGEVSNVLGLGRIEMHGHLWMLLMHMPVKRPDDL